ncbi:hypothetical protein [Salinimonas chungwhensis]|uniref:hypothetical protein n=1 Tax=Salinimonas chungwhensis TaxID=265425 RepID=UPI00037B0770|nr:hypothetical protein [Salinimonas chungwhensis]
MEVEVEVYSLIDKYGINSTSVKSLNSDNLVYKTTKTKSKVITEFAKDVFAGVTASSVLEVGKGLLEDLSDSFHSEPPIIIVEDSSGKPIGSGRMKSGKLQMDVILTPNGNPGEREWQGTVSTDLATRIDKSWSDYIVRGFGGGGACRITKTGLSGSEKMTMQVTCW